MHSDEIFSIIKITFTPSSFMLLEFLLSKPLSFSNALLRIKRIFKNRFLCFYAIELGDRPIRLPFRLQTFGIQESCFSSRSSHEVLLRYICNQIIEIHCHSERSCIIDIGSWIGDNSIPWAAKVQNYQDWIVLAIDPSPSNILFMKRTVRLNSISTLAPVHALCSDSGHTKYVLSKGSLNHGTFNAMSNEKSDNHTPTTLDEIRDLYGRSNNVLLMHVDVEGMETQVIDGAMNIIKKDAPYIIFENHIKSERNAYKAICSRLIPLGYKIFMINEVLPDCRLDCRNFLAVSGRYIANISLLSASYEKAVINPYFYPAMPLQQSLIYFEHEDKL